MPVAERGMKAKECSSDAVPLTMHLLFKYCQLKLSQKTRRIALKTSLRFFWKCWAYLIVFLVSMPISHTQDNFSICSLQGRSLEMYFLKKKKKEENSLRHLMIARAGGCEKKEELILKLQERQRDC